MRLEMDSKHYIELTQYLAVPYERVAFMFISRIGVGWRVSELRRLDDEHDYVDQSVHGAELCDHVLRSTIEQAHKLGSGLAEVHLHEGSRPAQFSCLDIDGLRELGPHVAWRLPGRPYIAIVLASSGFDAIAWTHGDGASTLNEWVVGGQSATASGLSLARLTGGGHT